MTDQVDTKPAEKTGAVNPTEDDVDAALAVIGDGAHYIVIARFPTMDDAVEARQTLAELEKSTSLRVDAVTVASCDAQGKIHLGEVTEHSTKTGVKWGAVGGAVIGIIFPPSLLAGVVAGGALGGIIGKIRNLMNRNGLADELTDVMRPNTAGLIAIVVDTELEEIQKALDQADEIVSKAIDKQLAAEIDREAAAAKQEVASHS